MSYPLFSPGSYQAGARVTDALGQVWEKLTKTSRVTVAPKAGVVWKLVPQEVALDGLAALTEKYDNLLTQLATQLADTQKQLAYVKDGKLWASELGVVAETGWGEAGLRNSDLVNQQLKAHPLTKLVFDKPGANLYLGATNGLCLDLSDFLGVLECMPGTTLKTEPGTIGLQNPRRFAQGHCHLLNLNLDGGLGICTNYMRTYLEWSDEEKRVVEKYSTEVIGPEGRNYVPIGAANAYNQDWGAYKPNAINLYSQAKLTDCNIYGYAGGAIANFANTTIRSNGDQIPVAGYFDERNGDCVFHADNADYLVNKLGARYDWHLVFDGIDYRIGGVNSDYGLTMGYAVNNKEKLGKKGKGYIYQIGLPWNADSCVMEGINNISNCGYGFFSTGDEANQYLISSLRMGDIGGPGFISSSLLKGALVAPHWTRCGVHFGEQVDGKWQFHMPCFTNRGDENGTTTVLHGYVEDGNQRPPYGGRNTCWLNGINYEGVDGAYGFVNGQLKLPA